MDTREFKGKANLKIEKMCLEFGAERENGY